MIHILMQFKTYFTELEGKKIHKIWTKIYKIDHCAFWGKHRVLLLLKRWKPPKQAYTQRRLVQPHYARASPPPPPRCTSPQVRPCHAAWGTKRESHLLLPSLEVRHGTHYGDRLWCEVQESSLKGTWKHLCWATFGWWKKSSACFLSGETKIHYIISSYSFNNPTILSFLCNFDQYTMAETASI